MGENVLVTKSRSLCSRGTTDVTSNAHFGAGLGDDLLSTIRHASQGLTQPPYSDVVDEDADDADAVADDIDIDPDPVH